MSFLFLFLAIFPLHVKAGVVRATPAQQSEIMSHVRMGLDARNNANAIKARMDSLKSDPEAWERLSWEEAASRKKAAAAFDLVIKKTSEFYGISPAGLQFGESTPARQGPMIGTAIQWAPTVLDADHLSFKYTDADGRTRYEAGAVNQAAGQTYGNGQVSIHIAMFELALKYDHPGSLAYVLHHEAQHFEEKATRQERSREESEMSAYKATLDAVDIFEMGAFGTNASTPKELPTKADWIAAFKQKRAEHAADLSAGLGRSVYMTPVEEAAAKDVFDIDQSELARIQAETARIKEAAARSRLERQERDRRERMAEEAKRRVMAEYQASASGCGLTPIMTQGDKTLGFKAGETANVYFTEPVTLAQAQAGMLMTRACWAGEMGQSEGQPCADALGAMQARWADPGFRHGLELDADAGNIDGCLRAIRENSEPPNDMKALNKRVSKYWRDWNVAAKRREMETTRELRRGQEESSRRARGDAEERSGRVPDQSYDLTPARRALEEARRSRF